MAFGGLEIPGGLKVGVYIWMAMIAFPMLYAMLRLSMQLLYLYMAY